MPQDLNRWLASTPAERVRDRAVDHAGQEADIASAQLSAIVDTAQRAQLGVLTLGLTKRQLGELVPEDAVKLDVIATSAVSDMLGVMSRLARRL